MTGRHRGQKLTWCENWRQISEFSGFQDLRRHRDGSCANLWAHNFDGIFSNLALDPTRFQFLNRTQTQHLRFGFSHGGLVKRDIIIKRTVGEGQ